ncbi:IS110 family transposase [Bradyrhizobium sp. 187]|uniref:IS110 family transposase n=1 Tax=Bradyrhizobium sp. 187 TaxID=2782655 RepID=UPI0020003289|nr:IS110 family transposase [Bradyrhizobium sp. 187]
MEWSGRAPALPAGQAGKGRQDKEHAMSQKLDTSPAVIGIDIGKNSFHIIGQNQRGIGLRQKWSRGQVETRLANLPPCLIGMEACVGAHHLSRKLQMLGHDARLMPAKYVRPYSKGQKNDFRDAEAIAEAVQRPTMKFVATKTADQLDLQALHRVRERLVGQRTGVIHQIRAFLLERGIALRQGLRSVRSELPGILVTRTDVLSPRMLRIIEDLAGDWRRLDERIEDLSSEIEALARQDKACERLMTVPGIGPIISSAMVAAIGTADVFSKGRDFGAWLGLVAKQISTGDRTILGKISRRQSLPARAVCAGRVGCAGQGQGLGALWPQILDRSRQETIAPQRAGHNVLAIALANKLARIAWAVLPSSASTRRRRRPELPDPRTVLGAVKARPGRGRARRQDSTTAGLDGPCARRVGARRPGRRNGRQARTKEQCEVRCDR